ncbi:MAG: hypothetical protein ACOC93_02410, partial [Planctomycetota bacterium]
MLGPRESPSTAGAEHQPGRLIEIGWVIVSDLHPSDMEGVRRGRDRALEALRETFPRFEWRMPLVQRVRPAWTASEEPMALLDEGANERDVQHWDFALVLTRVDLRSYYKPYA